MIVPTAALFRVAYGRFAIGAYNINNMEQALGLFRGHMEADAPFIVQISRGARTYAGIPMIEAITRALRGERGYHAAGRRARARARRLGRGRAGDARRGRRRHRA